MVEYIRKFPVPLFLIERNKLIMGILLYGFGSTIYLVTNRYHLFEPQLLPFSWIDEVAPFLPWTVWIYVSEYILFPAAYFTSKDSENLTRYAYAFIALQISSVFIFVFWPTTYPRELFPLIKENTDPFTYYLFSYIRAADTPASCAPSLHVSSCYLTSFIFIREQRKKFGFFFLWATLVGASTLTTKQHYIIDVIFGLVMAVSIYFLFFHWLEMKPIHWQEKLSRKIRSAFKKSPISGNGLTT